MGGAGNRGSSPYRCRGTRSGIAPAATEEWVDRRRPMPRQIRRATRLSQFHRLSRSRNRRMDRSWDRRSWPSCRMESIPSPASGLIRPPRKRSSPLRLIRCQSPRRRPPRRRRRTLSAPGGTEPWGEPIATAYVAGTGGDGAPCLTAPEWGAETLALLAEGEPVEFARRPWASGSRSTAGRRRIRPMSP